ncbi:MAG: BamA/TamA family outer membrane protein [Prochlorothrix sp.]|nr:BamA/TamA family outer membrane protein [Prochlorothrix sp.]
MQKAVQKNVNPRNSISSVFLAALAASVTVGSIPQVGWATPDDRAVDSIGSDSAPIVPPALPPELSLSATPVPAVVPALPLPRPTAPSLPLASTAPLPALNANATSFDQPSDQPGQLPTPNLTFGEPLPPTQPIVGLGGTDSAAPVSRSPRVGAQTAGTPDPIVLGQASEPSPGPSTESSPEPSSDSRPSATPPSDPEPATTPEPSPTVPTDPSSPTDTTRPPSPSPNPGTETVPSGEPRVLVSEVQVSGLEGHPNEAMLLEAVYGAIRLTAGEPTTRSALQEDLNAIFATGYFQNARFAPTDTPLGVRVTFIVDPNPTLTAVTVEGSRVLPPDLTDEIFGDAYGEILNLQDLQDGVQDVNKWYQDNGYVLGQVIDASPIDDAGQVVLTVAEGEVERVDVRFLGEGGLETDEEGNPIEGRTKPYVITREFSLKPGDVFNRNQAERDLQRVFGLGLFEDVNLSLDPSPDDPRKVIVVANVIEGSSGSIGAGAGLSSDTGLFGSISYQQSNFRGRNQVLGSELTLGEDALLFDLSFTDPWIKGDRYRTSYTVNAFRRRSISLVFDEGPRDVNLPNGDTPRIVRTGGGIRFSRPLSQDVYNPAVWNASLGLQYQRVAIQDSDGNARNVDELGNQLTASGDSVDDLLTLGFGLSRDLRNNRTQTTAGSLARISVDQSVPLGSGSILMNRIRGSYSYYIPINFLKFSRGCREEDPSPSDCPQTLAFNVQAGTVFGDLPPYEGFLLGGSNSVRGYAEGEVGTGRSFAQATAEYRFPVFSVVGGALFADFATDLGTGDNVPGEPAVIRQKPGGGFGVGLGVRVRSPIGSIRVDYGLNDQGDTRFHFGIGERF